MGKQKQDVYHVDYPAGRLMRNNLRLLKTLDILKRKTDARHPLSQNAIANLLMEAGIPTSQRTLSNLLLQLKEYYDVHMRSGKAKQSYGRIRFKNDEEIGDCDLDAGGSRTDFYFEHEFSERELQMLIEEALYSKNMTLEQKDILIKKIIHQGSEHSKLKDDYLCTMPNLIYAKQMPHIQETIAFLHQAITQDDGRSPMIQFHWNGYNHKGKLTSAYPGWIKVTPYYIAMQDGRYYLICNAKGRKDVSFYRIDLMSDVSFVKDETGNYIYGLAKQEVEGLDVKEYGRDDQTSDYMIRHMHMSYDTALRIQLKIDKQRYTAIFDYFGDTYKYCGAFDETHDLVEVRCSRFAIMNWAMQYSAYVEIMKAWNEDNSEVDLRKEMQERLEETLSRYKMI